MLVRLLSLREVVRLGDGGPDTFGGPMDPQGSRTRGKVETGSGTEDGEGGDRGDSRHRSVKVGRWRCSGLVHGVSVSRYGVLVTPCHCATTCSPCTTYSTCTGGSDMSVFLVRRLLPVNRCRCIPVSSPNLVPTGCVLRYRLWTDPTGPETHFVFN